MRHAAAFCGTRPGGWVGWVAIHLQMTFDITQTDGISFKSATCFRENLHRNEGCKCMSSLILEDELDIVTCLTVCDNKDVYTHSPSRPSMNIDFTSVCWTRPSDLENAGHPGARDVATGCTTSKPGPSEAPWGLSLGGNGGGRWILGEVKTIFWNG